MGVSPIGSLPFKYSHFPLPMAHPIIFAVKTLKIGKLPKGNWYPNHPFSGAKMLVAGRVGFQVSSDIFPFIPTYQRHLDLESYVKYL